MSKTIYFAAGWFSVTQKKAYQNSLDALRSNPSVNLNGIYIPLEHQFQDKSVEKHPELLEDKIWAMGTFNGDILGINQTDLTLATYIPGEEDVGIGVELGWAKAHGKPVVIVIPDKLYGQDINLMAFGIADNFIKMSELATFDFENIGFNFYEGKVY